MSAQARTWREETEYLLAHPRYGAVAESGPWMSLAVRIPPREVPAWWRRVSAAAGWISPSWAGSSPGGGKTRHIVLMLVQRKDLPLDTLREVPLGLLGAVAYSISHPENGWTYNVGERLDAAFGTGVAARLLTLAWAHHSVPWHGCHHPLGDVLPLLADERDFPLETVLSLDRQFRHAGWMGSGCSPQDLLAELRTGLTDCGVTQALAPDFGRCRAQYPDDEVQAAVRDAEAEAYIHPGFSPCAGSLLEMGSLFGHSPITRTAAGLIATTTLHLPQVFEVAAALECTHDGRHTKL